MALLRKFFFRKPPDGLFEISDRVYVFDYCFTTDVMEDENYKAYISGIVSQLCAHFPEGSFMVFNFRQGESQSEIANILSEHEMTVMDYPRQYEGCPLLTMEVIHHFLRSSESWLLLGQSNVLLMHCERGGWSVLAFMLAGLLIYRKQYASEQKTLDMIHRQAPHELLQLFSPLNPLPSQLRYLQYISRRNLGSEWPPKDRELTMDCIILRSIPNIDGKGGCRPILRIYGQNPLLARDNSPQVLFSMPKKSKVVRHYKQADCGLVKIDVNCHIKGDVVLECISLDDELEREAMMFRVMFNTSFIRSNILILNHDEVDTLWDAKDFFPKEFRAEVIFSEMDAPTSLAAINLPAIVEKEELPVDAFAKVHEIFSNVNWLDSKRDLLSNVLEQITTPTHLKQKLHPVPDQETEPCNPEASTTELEEKPKSQTCRKGLSAESPRHADLIHDRVDPLEKSEISSCQKGELGTLVETVPEKLNYKPDSQTLESISSPTSMALEKQSMPSSRTSAETISTTMKTQPDGWLPVLQQPNLSMIVSPRFSHSSHSSPTQRSNSFPSSPLSVSRYHGTSPSLGITAVLDNHAAYRGQDTSQSSVESPSFSSSSVASVPDVTNSVHSSAQSPLPPSQTPPPPPPPPALPSEQNADSSAPGKLSQKSPELANSPDDHHDRSSVKTKVTPFLVSSGKLSPKSSDFPPPPKLSQRSPTPFTPSPPSSCLPPPPLSPGCSLPPHKMSSFSKPPPPPPPPPAGSPKSAVGINSSLSSSNKGTAVTTPLPPPLPPKSSGLVPNTSSLVPPPPPPPRVSITSPAAGISQSCPPVPPPPSAKGFSKDTAQPPPVTGSNGAIPPPPGPLSNAKGRGLTRIPAKNPNQSKKATLKPYHWLKLTRVMQGSLWAEAQKSEEASKGPEIDMKELENLFAASAPYSQQRSLGGKSSNRASGPKSDKVQLIELRRAYNCEIMLSKVKIPLPDLMNSVLALDESGLDIDQVENLIKFCPTKEEMELLKGYTGDRENLGKCEQFFLELMKVPRVESKLRVFCFRMQFSSQVSELRKNLNIVNSASEEVRNSEKLRRIMHTILQLGNALNQGTTRGSAVGFRLDSLLKLTDTRARNNKMTLMHYLCKVLAEKLPELLDFPNDLPSLEASTKIQLKILAEEMQAISKGLEKVAQELTTSENDGPVSETFRKLLKVFLSFAEGEVRSLASLYSYVGRNADALAMYFGEDPAKCPYEQVVSTLLNFMRMFVRVHDENCKQLEFEKKKAQKEAENEKLRMSSPVQPATKMGGVK